MYLRFIEVLQKKVVLKDMVRYLPPTACGLFSNVRGPATYGPQDGGAAIGAGCKY